ncbi:ABC-type glycerol-3-phosphate transport system, substrate-binding protein [Gracilibacillus orientalis]|uniref:ABC-type glycerol-3-phosphate transport system, substrate-binding protein n=1 Tax=Gracilibacillus orientalis TaxID=334253 RepID=A0A1I4JS17_9BACI|nr:extracellular solute-binding protein [Gracilibacillus orientalis]SFL69395.1 ABC-type glycerol-3-phosphate transport system, substrate-binding protein [Gracilibacillus orientalis]
MKQGKSFWLMLLFMFVVAVLAVGCSSDDTAGDNGSGNDEGAVDGEWEGQTIKVQLIGDFDLEDSTDPITGETTKGLQVIKDEFESQHPGATVEFIIMPWEGYTEKTQAMITSGEADVYQMPGIADFAAQDVLEPLEPYIENDSEFDLDIFIDNQVNGWKALGSDSDELGIYGLPFLGDARFIAYDKQLFDEWGVEYLSEHPTMEEIEEKAKQMTGENPVSGEENYGIWFRGDWSSAFTLINIAEGQNGSWGNGFAWDEIEFNFDSPEMESGLEWLLDMKEYAPDGLVSDQGSEKWLTPDNDIAIMLNQGPGDTIMPAYAQGLGDRIAIAQEFKNDEGVGGMFAGSPITMAKDSENKDLAWEWMKFATSETVQQYIFEEANGMPAIKAAETWDSYAEVKNLMDPTMEAMSTPWTPRYPWASSQPRFILTSEVEAALTGERSATEAVEKAQKESQEWLKNRN